MRPLFLVNRVLRAPDSKKIMLDHPFTTAGSPGNGFEEFLKWVNDPNCNTYPATVVSIVETIRDAIMAQHSITPDAFIKR